MQSHSQVKAIHRIIDANINRVKEGLRVAEEITRFFLENRRLTEGFKKIRHNIDTISRCFVSRTHLLKARNSDTDLGREIFANELRRKNCQDIFSANIQRTKESLRVLEEFTQLVNKSLAVDFKSIRYEIYELEKRAVKKISALSNT